MKTGAFLFSCCLIASLAQADELPYIDEIRFSGNRVTEEAILRQELFLTEGEQLDSERVERSRRALMNLGLFKTVVARMEEEGELNVLYFELDERYFILPIPLLGAKPDDEEYSYGFELRFDNLLGLNQRLKLSFEQKHSIDDSIRAVNESEVAYRYPRVMGSYVNLNINARLKSQEIVLAKENEDIIDGGFERKQYLLGFGISRWLKPIMGSQGWLFGGGLGMEQRDYQNAWGSGEGYHKSLITVLNMEIAYHEVTEHQFYREGYSAGYQFSQSLGLLGSDHHFTRHLLYRRGYYPIHGLDANFNSQIQFGVANGESFDSPAYGLGGSNLRGYPDGIGPGNVMLQLNLEYHQRISAYRPLRAVIFSDIGNVWPEVSNIDRHGFHHSLGFGLRWRVQNFVDTTLRLDYGYGLRTDQQRAYLSTRANF